MLLQCHMSYQRVAKASEPQKRSLGCEKVCAGQIDVIILLMSFHTPVCKCKNQDHYI